MGAQPGRDESLPCKPNSREGVGRPALWPPCLFAGVRNFAGYACRGRRPRRPAKGSSPALQINRERGAAVNLRAGHARPLQSGFHSIHRITFVASTKSCDSYRCCAPSFWASTCSSRYSSRRLRAQRLAAASSWLPMPCPRTPASTIRSPRQAYRWGSTQLNAGVQPA